ncbi:predicted protein [Sclerotinia sclerotiorum 1980 UF-70]|uniref:Uncharacterized protein n=1 Tax=Sclerotinia sclerotiorum (strain ATCC 18683 / 1980 / Ss-1) TaxID=665079 RepID=A7EJY2_SCLS1|nr:predicted protein [Sclerotinia sclerotiorum 1980 UF-70]EDO03148.1 predicted protein [Sclerotinia sclerotiorum 1980 UF-70]
MEDSNVEQLNENSAAVHISVFCLKCQLLVLSLSLNGQEHFRMPSALLRTSTNSSFKFFVLEEKCLFYVVPLSYIESIVKRRPLADDGKNEKTTKIFARSSMAEDFMTRRNARSGIRMFLENITVIMRTLKNPGKSIPTPLFQVLSYADQWLRPRVKSGLSLNAKEDFNRGYRHRKIEKAQNNSMQSKSEAEL